MSYLVLARKYRPRSFAEMVGQEHVVQALGNALTRQRLHHAYLFTGTRGVGKTTVARVLAKSLNCTGPDGTGGITATPCGVCPACRDIDSGRFVDYVELDAASNRGVEEISQLLDQAVYKPVLGRFKVYLIDEVHMLSTTAFNAMLKTLEEPPEYLKFVLATTDPQKVPVTVLSRCLQFNLRPMAPQTIVEHLAQVLAAEQIEAEPGALRLLARGAQGSMRDALSLTDQAIAFGAGGLLEASVRQMLGAVDRSHVVRIVEALINTDGRAMVTEVDGLRALGLSAAGTLEELAALAQQMALLQAVPDAADPTDPDTPTVQRLAPQLPADETQLLYSLALHGRAELGLAPDEYGALLMVLLRLLAFRPQGGSLQRSEAVAGPASAAPVASSPVAAPTGTTAAAVPARHLPPSAASVPQNQAAPTAPTAPTVAPVAPRAVPPAPSPIAAAPMRPPAPAPLPVATPPAPAPVPASAPAARASTGASNFDEPPWMRGEEPPLEDLAGPGASEPPPWDDAAGPASAAARPQRTARPMTASAVRTSAPLLATAAAQARYLPRDQAATSAKPVTAAVVAVSGDATAAVARPDRPAMVRSNAQINPVPDLAVTASAPAARPTSLARQVVEPLAEVPADPLTDGWIALLQPLLERQLLTGFARELGWQAQCVGLALADEPRRIVLRVERESLRQGAHRERLQAALAEQIGAAVKLEVEAGPVADSAARRDAAAKARAQRQAEAVIRDDPLVQSLLARFPGAQLVPGSIRPVSL